MATADGLADRAANFAAEVQRTLDGVLPGERRIVSVRFETSERYVVRPAGDTPEQQRIPLYVAGARIADLTLALYLALDRHGRYLKTVQSNVTVTSVLDKLPLVRLEYDSDMRTEPVAHWQIHAERGAFSHLLTRANLHRPKRVSKPHDLSSLHIPVGGERFRPCLEDVLQFLVLDCGVDHQEGWQAYVERGREEWRRRQLGSAVRDVPTEAARVLRELGWAVTPPADEPQENVAALTKW